MEKKFTVFLGDVARDEYYKADKFPRLGDKVIVRQQETYYGGMIANAACVFAGYGGDIRFSFSLNPRDKDLCDELETHGIDTSLVVYDDVLPDSKCIIVLSEDTHTVLIVTMSDHKLMLTREIIDEIAKAETIYSNPFEIKRLQCIGEDVTPADIVKQWADAGVKIVCDMDVDTVDDEYDPILKYMDTLFMNDVGFEALTEHTNGNAVQSLLDAGVKTVVVTLAERGCEIYTEGKKYAIPGVITDIVDVTGAGDTFNSTFTFARDYLGDVEDAAVFATYAASRSIMEMGARAGNKTIEEVLEYMEAKGGPADKFRKLFGK